MLKKWQDKIYAAIAAFYGSFTTTINNDTPIFADAIGVDGLLLTVELNANDSGALCWPQGGMGYFHLFPRLCNCCINRVDDHEGVRYFVW